MPIDRRQFIAGSGALIALAPLASCAIPAASGFSVVLDPSVPESLLFADSFDSARRLAGGLADSLALQRSIETAVVSSGVVFGCTKGAQSFVIEQILRGTGLQLEVFGRHQQTGARSWTHNVRLKSNRTLESMFTRADWPRRLSAALIAGRLESSSRLVTVQSTYPRVPNSQGFVTTWRVRNG